MVRRRAGGVRRFERTFRPNLQGFIVLIGLGGRIQSVLRNTS